MVNTELPIKTVIYNGIEISLDDPPLQEKTTSPTKSEQVVIPDSPNYGLSKVTVSAIPDQYIIPTGSQTINSNDTYDVTSLAEVVVNVIAEEPNYDTPNITVSTGGLITASANGKSNTSQLSTQAGTTITPSETEQTAVASGKYTTGAVKVGAISTTYVGSGITKRSSTDLTASGATVTVPSGYYASNASKAIGNGSVTLNAPTVNATGLVTASGTVSAGYVSTNPSNKTLQLTTKAGSTITPNNSQQTAISSGTYATGNIVVSAVPTETKTVSENGTVTPSSGKYFSSVTVNIPIQKYYTGSTVPSSSLGNDGDIYLMTV